MQKIIAIIVCWCWFLTASAQPNITRVEYFIDTDPGFGKATSISITPSANISNGTFNVSIGSLSTGIHALFIRSRDANGKWSVTNSRFFYKPAASGGGALPNITRVEYFIDTDPGFGNAINIPVTAGSNLQNISFTASISTLPTGIHALFIRSRDANGKWSVTNNRFFYKPDSTLSGTPPNITNVEYFIDNDPGFGKATPIAINPSTNLANFMVPVNISGLSVGNHIFFIRSRSATGYSITNAYTFPIAAVAAAPYINVNSFIVNASNCASDSFNISYDAKGTYNAGNVFNVQLSDAAGSFTSPITIGSYTGTVSTIIKAKLPAHIPDGANYKVRVSSTNPVVTGVAIATTITIHDRPTAQTITGNSNPNMGSSFPYSVPSFAGSAWLWIAPAATITQTANSANLVFNVLGPQTIKIIETNQFGCIGDTSTKDVIVMGVLPVTYVSFTATAENDKVILKWTTATEINSKDFKVQRSLDGINFETIATIPAAGTSNNLRNYVFHDLQSISLKGKVIFFRIVEADVDGKLLYTNIKSVKIPDGKNKLTLVYNPVRNEALLKYDCSEKDKIQIRVVDHLGRVISTIEQKVQPGINEIKLHTGHLAKGIYEVGLTGNNDRQHVRMMKE